MFYLSDGELWFWCVCLRKPLALGQAISRAQAKELFDAHSHH